MSVANTAKVYVIIDQLNEPKLKGKFAQILTSFARTSSQVFGRSRRTTVNCSAVVYTTKDRNKMLRIAFMMIELDRKEYIIKIICYTAVYVLKIAKK